MKVWNIPPDWDGEDAFIICGGTSVTQAMADRTQGRHVIAINSSYQIAPHAEILFFADERWWTREYKERPKLLETFKGKIATTSRQAKGDRLLRLKRAKMPPGIATSPDSVIVRRTSLHAALNICYHKRAGRIILLGADNRDGDNGRAHHHAEYPWKRIAGTWDTKLTDLAHTVEPLKAAGIEVINCSHISTLPWWPKQTLGQALRGGRNGG
jgi:hypothetical protein